ncbi:ubiquitin carboxyl-terminal hydrolase 10 isoform X2 [Aethina tumida]|uniref:ubiquitin carboxyl-terminal hydrolase 10 isoform X2 n=1 Tax=Aethina tumida TaxID=116153 RepID=UPI0021493C61|nr:ubiquitin carboxyl-terminal hydrolase 10 isoform X2 [Aethina tumida]
MDYANVESLEFLDLSGVDDVEKRKVLSSLHTYDSSVKLPWIKPQKRVQRQILQQNLYPQQYQPSVEQVTFPQTFNSATPVLNDKQPHQQHQHQQQQQLQSIPGHPPVHNGVHVSKPDSPQSGRCKTWASLFSGRKEGEGAANVDPHIKSQTRQPMTPESNNNNVGTPFKRAKKQKYFDPDCYRMGEFLDSYAVDGRTISLQPRGLINQSNYCFINSILQALIACVPMYNLLIGLSSLITSNEKRKPTPVIDGLCRFVTEFKHLPAGQRVGRKTDKGQKNGAGPQIMCEMPFEAGWIYKLLNRIRPDLVEGRQEDAEEFLGCLLNGLSDEMLELIKLVKNEPEEKIDITNDHDDNEGEMDDKEWLVMGKKKCSVTRRTDFDRTPISDIFGGFLKSRIHRAGDHDTENIQPFFTLPLNIEMVNTVSEALDALVSKNKLEGVTSSKTNEEVEAWQQVLLDELPVILILHLKCFDFKLDGCKKIIKALEFPIDLKIDSKLLSKANNSTKKQYKLFAVVYHDGKEASKGHYITDAFHVGYNSWLRYDDASVKPVTEEQVLKPQGTRVPYLLFYRRSDTIRSK